MGEGALKHLLASGMMGKKLKVEYDGGCYRLTLPEKRNLELFLFQKATIIK